MLYCQISVSLRFASKQENQNGGIIVKTKYYEYNPDSNGDKYVEVSRRQFEKNVINNPKRYYISFGDSVLECEKDYFLKYSSQRRHSRYISEIRDGVKPVFEEYHDDLEDGDMSYTAVEEAQNEIVENGIKMKGYKFAAALPVKERKIFTMYYLNNFTQQEIADEFSTSQQNISKICKDLLCKFNEF